jgi:hypothetical protein
MSACPLLTFNGVDAAGWGRIKALVKQTYDVTVSTDSGSASAAGFSIGWNYANGALNLECLAKPMFIPCDTINAHLTAAVNSALAGGA